ncbi:unnamed protein product [Caenorhabditis bovis]|uniref:Uncharacterized protein n=1 Tax=Caenorhabditis bovis TaxID=2654633 RepID=A0A8S1F070_9PELO|nr:unnamed protein product [Caenorhabditis bovis]
MRMKCAICESAATSLHFGTPSCKACAAFFRRTVALDITYNCITGKNKCDVNFERRMACKKCRYDKCIRNNMQRDMVQSKQGRLEDATLLASPESPSTSSPIDDSKYFNMLNHFIQMESNLNKSRRMAFTDSKLIDIFSGICEMPYEFNQLRPFDFQVYTGYGKHEYVMMFNYTSLFPDFNKLDNSEQNFMFRICCGVDYILSSVYYTHRIGREKNMAVYQDGTYLKMDKPLLKNGMPGDPTLSLSKEELEKYKNLMRPKMELWSEFLPKYEFLKCGFEENILLKALCCWQFSKMKFGENGKLLCSIQSSKITNVLLRFCQDKYGKDEGLIRASNIVLFVSTVHEEIMELIRTLIVVTVFEIVNGDTLIDEILNSNTIFA